MTSVLSNPLQPDVESGFVNPFAHLDTKYYKTPLHERLLSKPANKQLDCALFSILPAEIRSHIFRLVLADYEDPSAAEQYTTESCYARPSYSAPRRTDTAILRTSRAVYGETWFLPFILREQTHWITGRDRAPPEYHLHTSIKALKGTVFEIKREHKEPVVEIDSLRVFTQMFKIEGDAVASFLEQVPDLAFRRLIITIRHADFWYWEDDEPLRFESGWIQKLCLCLPSTVCEVVIEMETVSRKSAQLDDIANQMAQSWHFRTKDGKALFADATANSHEVSRWQGSSCWLNTRWIRDEIAPGVIEFYVGAVRFRPKHAIERADGKISEHALHAASVPLEESSFPRLHLPDATRMECDRPSVKRKTGDNKAANERARRGRWQ